MRFSLDVSSGISGSLIVPFDEKENEVKILRHQGLKGISFLVLRVFFGYICVSWSVCKRGMFLQRQILPENWDCVVKVKLRKQMW